MLHILRDFSKNTTFQGYRYLVDPELFWPEKVFWFCCILGSTGAGIFMMIFSYEAFSKHPISQTVDTLYLRWQSRFPTIIFCQTTNVTLVELLLQEHFNESIVSSCSEGFQEYLYFRGRIARPPCGDTYMFDDLDFLDLYKKSVSSCSQLFTFCDYQQQPFNCCEAFQPVETMEGICYAMNSARQPSQTLPVFTFTNQGYLRVEVRSLMSTYFASAEELLTITERNQLIAGIPEEKSQYAIYARIQEVMNDDRIARLPVDLRGCRFPSENYLNWTNMYSHSACVLDCLERTQAKMRGCVAHTLPSARRGVYKVCKMSDLQYLSQNRDQILEEVLCCECDISCNESDIYRIAVIEERNYNGFVDVNSKFRVDLVMVKSSIRYSRNMVKDNIDLIVSLGGIGTLFLGASLLSIVEIIYYFFIRPYGDKYILKLKPKIKKGRQKRVYPMETRVQTIQVTPMPKDFENVKNKYLSMRKPYPYLK